MRGQVALALPSVQLQTYSSAVRSLQGQCDSCMMKLVCSTSGTVASLFDHGAVV